MTRWRLRLSDITLLYSTGGGFTEARVTKLDSIGVWRGGIRTMQTPIVISIEGNIGAGKSTMMEMMREVFPEAEIVVEPVGEWMQFKNKEGKSLLELFYEDKRRWAYTFQNCALLTRTKALSDVIASTKKQVIITERSILTDRYVFADMLREAGDIDEMEWSLYLRWYERATAQLSTTGIIYLGTNVTQSAEHIIRRGRPGEECMSLDYLKALDYQHKFWLDHTDLPVLKINIAEGGAPPFMAIREFIQSLDQHRDGPCSRVVCDFCHPGQTNITLADEGVTVQTGPRCRRRVVEME